MCYYELISENMCYYDLVCVTISSYVLLYICECVLLCAIMCVSCSAMCEDVLICVSMMMG
jgi:hypothetical protein